MEPDNQAYDQAEHFRDLCCAISKPKDLEEDNQLEVASVIQRNPSIDLTHVKHQVPMRAQNVCSAVLPKGPMRDLQKEWDDTLNAVVDELAQYKQVQSKKLQFWFRKTRREYDANKLTEDQAADFKDLTEIFEVQ